MSTSKAGASPAPDLQAPIPRQIPFIIGNEGCERFSFYGMRNILTVFLVSSLLTHLPEADRASAAKDVFHTFVIGVYFFPLLGGWLADRFWRHGLPNVFLCRLRLRRRPGLRARGAELSAGG